MERNKLNELEKCESHIETRMETVQELKYKIQNILIKKAKLEELASTFIEQLDEEVARFDVVVANLEDALKRLVDGEVVKTNQLKD